jgi:uncharacterized protein (TIGR02996 family)
MSELDRLHAEVVKNPAPDAPRVAYADAVAATDPDRAELVRVQLQLLHSRRKGEPALARADAYTRQDVLLDRHKDAWGRPITAVPGVQFLRFLRGFVEQVRMTARDFLAHGAEVYARAPILHLDLVELAPLAREVFGSPLLGRIHSLRLTRNKLDDAAAESLAASPHLGNLRWLDLTYNQITQRGLDAICASTNLPALRFVDLGDNIVDDPTPRIGETDVMTNAIVRVEIPQAARALEARFGKRPWLSYESAGTFPPERDQF